MKCILRDAATVVSNLKYRLVSCERNGKHQFCHAFCVEYSVFQKIQLLEGRQPASIIRELNAAGCRTAFGRPFGRTSLNTILKNERYIGTFLWNGIKKPNAIPAIVNPEEWQKVQEITKAKKKCIAKSRGENYLLTGRLFCGQCGGSMVGTAGNRA